MQRTSSSPLSRLGILRAATGEEQKTVELSFHHKSWFYIGGRFLAGQSEMSLSCTKCIGTSCSRMEAGIEFQCPESETGEEPFWAAVL